MQKKDARSPTRKEWKQQTDFIVRNRTKPSGSAAARCPVRLLAECVVFARAQDVAQSQAVSKSWQLPPETLDRLFRAFYLADFEADTIDRPEIANEGRGTTWAVRYKRRLHIHRNWLRETYTLRHLCPVAAFTCN